MTAANIWGFDSRSLGYAILRPNGTIYNITAGTWDTPPATLTTIYVQPMPKFNTTCAMLANTYLLPLISTLAGTDGYSLAVFSLDTSNNPIEQVDLYPVYYTSPNPTRVGVVAVR